MRAGEGAQVVAGDFHTHGGWFWIRRFDGAVLIQRRTVNGNIAEEHVLSASEWASVVASMSLRGESDATRCEALELHLRATP
jgi:hypothetical protein